MGGMISSTPPEPAADRPPPTCWLTDMDGVLWHQGRALPGAADFLARLTERGRRFLVLTNNSSYTPRDLAARLARAGLHVPEEAIWTSALGAVLSGLVAMNRAPAPMSRIAVVMASKEYVRVSPSTT